MYINKERFLMIIYINYFPQDSLFSPKYRSVTLDLIPQCVFIKVWSMV